MKRFLSISICILLMSCGKVHNFIAPGYIAKYITYEANSIVLNSTIDDTSIVVHIGCRHYNSTLDASVFEYYYRKKASTYYELCQKFGDTSYNQHCNLGEAGFNSNGVEALAILITDIDIYSSSDWDDSHPAGTSLRSLFSVRYKTIYPYIQSLYSASDVWTEVDIPLCDNSGSIKLLKLNEPISNSLNNGVERGKCAIELYTSQLPIFPQTLTIILTTDTETLTMEANINI